MSMIPIPEPSTSTAETDPEHHGIDPGRISQTCADAREHAPLVAALQRPRLLGTLPGALLEGGGGGRRARRILGPPGVVHVLIVAFPGPRCIRETPESSRRGYVSLRVASGERLMHWQAVHVTMLTIWLTDRQFVTRRP
ncbi:hypothetical protein GCM10018952_34860 [Streptosporangium vulgare]